MCVLAVCRAAERCGLALLVRVSLRQLVALGRRFATLPLLLQVRRHMHTRTRAFDRITSVLSLCKGLVCRRHHNV